MRASVQRGNLHDTRPLNMWLESKKNHNRWPRMDGGKQALNNLVLCSPGQDFTRHNST